MREPAAKRRKISPSEDEESEHSFAEFDEEANNDAAEEEDAEMSGDGEDEVMGDGSSEEEDDDDGESEAKRAAAVSTETKPTPKTQPDRRANGTTNGTAAAFTGEVYKSNVFKLQVDDLLQGVHPKYTTKDKAIGEVLRKLKNIIEAIPARAAAPIAEAEAALRKRDNIVIPFPEPRPPKDANYKLQFAKPSHINAVGSFPLNLATKTGDEIAIDLLVTLPDKLLQEKDYLNHRYFYKRAYYLACLAAGIKAQKEEKFKVSFEKLHGNQLAPVLVMEVDKTTHPGLELPCNKLKVVILPAVAEGTFNADKLQPGKNCVRPKDGSNSTDAATPLPPTSFYNATLRADGLITSYLTLQHQASKQSEAYRDASMLGRTWLRQRGLSSCIESGGFGNFEWSVLIALLLRGGGSNGKPAFSAGYSSYQLFKAMLQYLASRDLVKSPQVIGTVGTKPNFPSSKGVPMLFDAERGVNVLFKMSPWSYRLLQYEAKASVAMLGDATFDHFDETFILRSDRPLLRYDVVVEIPLSILAEGATLTYSLLKEKYIALYGNLTEGLSDRVKLVSLTPPEKKPWHTGGRLQPSGADILRIGFVLDATNAHRLIDHGPSAEEKAASAKFRMFWGAKAELRRFRDGSITETVVWSAKDSTQHTVFRRVLTFILEKHASPSAGKEMTYAGDSEVALLPAPASGATTTTPFQLLTSAFRKLEQDLRALEDLPLQIRHLLAADPFLSSSSIAIPHTPHSLMSRPANVVLQFEGSARWPDDLDAIQRTKMAFFLKIASSLESTHRNIRARVGLENGELPLLNQSFLDVHYVGDVSSDLYGTAFRVRVHHDRELTLLERRMKDKSLSLSQAERQEVAHAIAEHKRVFLKECAHTQALQTLVTRFPAFSGTVRLLGLWIAKHKLGNHLSPYLTSLLAARAFTNPYPWQPASSPQTGFLRTLLFLSRWNWRSEPWIADLGSEMASVDVQGMRTRFEAWRKIDPAMNRVVLFAGSNLDPEGVTWSDSGRPAKVVAARLVSLAKAALAEVSDKGARLVPEVLFESPLGDYDFVIHLATQDQKGKKAKVVYKNLALQHGSSGGVDDFTLASGHVGFEPTKLFLADLERVFGHAALFFHDDSAQGAEVIAGLWNPGCEGRPWKLSLGYNSIPSTKSRDAVEAGVNRHAVLAEIARLGGDMIRKVEAVKK
jgi:U3 small nucleolar RNA-associated protein 22